MRYNRLMEITQKIQTLYFAFILRQKLQEKEMKQADLLKLLNEKTQKKTQKQQMERWASGKVMPSEQTKTLLAEALGADVSSFELDDVNGLKRNAAFLGFLDGTIDRKKSELEKEISRRTLEIEELEDFKKYI